MASLDGFLMRAARLPRLASDVGRASALGSELLKEAVELLPQHVERSTEIAMAVGRVGSLAEPTLVKRFAEAYQQLLSKRLPESQSFSKAQAREALAAYVAIEGLGCGAASSLASQASTAAELLEGHELAAALARLAATRSSAPLSQIRDLNASAEDVAVALQKGLLKKGKCLSALSAQDLCNAVVGLARSPLIVPDAVAAIATAARGRCSELRFRSLLDFSRAVGELMAAINGHQRQQVADCLAETFPILASEVQRSFQDGEPDKVGLCLSGLVRIAATLPDEGSEAASFVREVISPSAENILLVCQDDGLEFFEVAAPLLQLEGGEAWTKLLQYLALEGLQKLPDSQESISRLVSILEWAASKDGHISCPPFFDFAVQELSQRMGGALATPADVRKAAKLLMFVHLERPDLLPASAAAIAKTSLMVQPTDLPEVALSLSAMAGLYLRIASLGTSTADVQKHKANESNDDTAVLAGSLEVLSQTAQGLLGPTNSQSDAAFLALSAFAQACRHGNDSDPVRRRVVLSGVQLLDALCQAWTTAWNEKPELLSLQQAHIFVTCVRTFCIGKGAPAPPPSTLQVLDVVLQSITAANHKDARLCLAVLPEIHGDPICPPLLKSLLEAQGVKGEKGGEGAEGGLRQTDQQPGARERLRASMASGSVASQSPQGGFLRRIFGF